jgi:hypothetical protein
METLSMIIVRKWNIKWSDDVTSNHTEGVIAVQAKYTWENKFQFPDSGKPLSVMCPYWKLFLPLPCIMAFTYVSYLVRFCLTALYFTFAKWNCHQSMNHWCWQLSLLELCCIFIEYVWFSFAHWLITLISWLLNMNF